MKLTAQLERIVSLPSTSDSVNVGEVMPWVTVVVTLAPLRVQVVTCTEPEPTLTSRAVTGPPNDLVVGASWRRATTVVNVKAE
jgi:hypothetical protein